MPTPGPETQVLCSRLYAMSGEWPAFLATILDGDPIPKELVEAGERLRKVWIRVETEKELKAELDPPKRKTVTWINDDGEEVSINGYEPENEEDNEEAATLARGGPMGARRLLRRRLSK